MCICVCFYDLGLNVCTNVCLYPGMSSCLCQSHVCVPVCLYVRKFVFHLFLFVKNPVCLKGVYLYIFWAVYLPVCLYVWYACISIFLCLFLCKFICSYFVGVSVFVVSLCVSFFYVLTAVCLYVCMYVYFSCKSH